MANTTKSTNKINKPRYPLLMWSHMAQEIDKQDKFVLKNITV